MRFLLLIFLVFLPNAKVFSQSYLDYFFKSKGVNGSFLIYNLEKDSYVFTNEQDIKKTSPPAATFFLVQTLLGFQNQSLNPENENIFYWNGLKNYFFKQPKPQWNCNTTLSEALNFKNQWYFKELSKKITNKQYEDFFNQVNYSNKKIDKSISEDFWNYSLFGVNDTHQVEFLKLLHLKKLPFSLLSQEAVLKHMNTSVYDNQILYTYSGYTVYKANHTDWLIGILKSSKGTFIFSMRIYHWIEKQNLSHFFDLKYQITQDVFEFLELI